MRRLFSIVALLVACQHAPPSDPIEPLLHEGEPHNERSARRGFRITLLKEEVPEHPRKRLVREHLVLHGDASSDDLTRFLRDRVHQISGRADQVALYVYASRAHYESGAGQWVAMATWPQGHWRTSTSRNTEPRITINSDHLSAMKEMPSDRFGMNEAKRKRVYVEVVQAEERAEREAGQDMERYDELQEAYSRAVARRNGLTYDQLRALVEEGLERNWPIGVYQR